MEGYEESFPSTVARLLNSMYVEDMVCGSDTKREAYQLYFEPKAEADLIYVNLLLTVLISRGELMRKNESHVHHHLSARF